MLRAFGRARAVRAESGVQILWWLALPQRRRMRRTAAWLQATWWRVQRRQSGER